jgi:hypothetical protein
MLSEKEFEKLQNMTVVELAQMLEDGLLHGCWLHEETNVIDFLKKFVTYNTK